MITLTEIRKAVQEPTAGEFLPSPKQLFENSEIYMRKEMGTGKTVLTVFTNGYVMYQIGSRYTVFPLSRSRSYVYSFALNDMETGSWMEAISEDFLDHIEWYIPLMLVGEDRLSHNLACKEHTKCLSMDAMIGGNPNAGKKASKVKNYYSSDIEENYIQKEQVSEFLEVLNKRQKAVVERVYWEQKTHEEIADEMGMRCRTSVTNMLQLSIKKMRKAADLSDKKKYFLKT